MIQFNSLVHCLHDLPLVATLVLLLVLVLVLLRLFMFVLPLLFPLDCTCKAGERGG